MKSLPHIETSFVILRCHCNATDIGLDMQINAYFSWRLSCEVFAFDYCGYGCCSGKPNESNTYNDVIAAYNFLTKSLLVDPVKIVVYGTSIGTVAAIHLASSGLPLKGLILEGILMSAFRFLCPNARSSMICDQLSSAFKVPQIKCPTLVVQGGYDDLPQYKSFWKRLEIFFGCELGGGPMPFYTFCGYQRPFIHDEQPSDDTDKNLGKMHLPLNWPFEQPKFKEKKIETKSVKYQTTNLN